MNAKHLSRMQACNLSFLWAASDQSTGMLRADIAIVATHTDVKGMMKITEGFAPVAIDIYGELIEDNPAAFDDRVREMRGNG